jgi:hypothetical protein
MWHPIAAMRDADADLAAIRADLEELKLSYLAHQLEAESRLAALETVLRIVADKAGLPQQKVGEMLAGTAAQVHAAQLLRVETFDPALAAALDRRPAHPESPELDVRFLPPQPGQE